MPLQASGPSFLSQRHSGTNILHSLHLSAWPVYEKAAMMSKYIQLACLCRLSPTFTQFKQLFFIVKTQILHELLPNYYSK